MLYGVNVSAGSVSELSKATSNLVKKTPKGVLSAVAFAGILGAGWFTCTERGRKQAKSIGKTALPVLISGARFVAEGIHWTQQNENRANSIRNNLERS